MKTLGSIPSLVAGTLLFFSASTIRASGPGGGVVGSTGGTSTGGASAGGTVGGRSGGVRSSAVSASSGARPNVSFSNSAPRMTSGGSNRGSVTRASAPASYPSGLTNAAVFGPRTSYQNAARPTNAWSGAPTNTPANDRAPGQHLLPGAPGGNLVSQNHGNGRRLGNYRFRSRSSYDPYGYGRAYAPYIDYGGGYDGAYPYYADSDLPNGYQNATATVTPEYVNQGPAADPKDSSRSGDTNAQPTVPGNGPDSLVEAVQGELIRRGYFAGKADAMYGPETKDALKKFQKDHNLADTGLINEATMHALQLD